MPIEYYIYLSLTLFSIGVIGVLTRRNAIIVFMCVELMLNAVNLLLVAFSKMNYGITQAISSANTSGIDAQIFVFFIKLITCQECFAVWLNIIIFFIWAKELGGWSFISINIIFSILGIGYLKYLLKKTYE